MSLYYVRRRENQDCEERVKMKSFFFVFAFAAALSFKSDNVLFEVKEYF